MQIILKYQRIKGWRQPVKPVMWVPFLSFGGFEYLERFYVALGPSENGSVVLFAQGIPWNGRLNHASVARVAKSVSESFDQLALYEDPFDKNSGENATGKDMVVKIRELETEHPQLAEKPKRLVLRSVIDWAGILARADFSRPLTFEQSRALRLALRFAVDRKDVNLINRLHEKQAPFTPTLSGKDGIFRWKALGFCDGVSDLRHTVYVCQIPRT